MGRKPVHHPKPEEIEVDDVLTALADPIRRDVLRRIASDGPQFCGDLVYEVAKSTLSHHLKILRESGLMHTEVLGKYRRVTRRDKVIDTLFPGLLTSVGLPPGQGQWDEPAASTLNDQDANAAVR